MTDNTNPGNFANRPKEEVQEIASKGGQTGNENKGFASMDADKQVRELLAFPPQPTYLQRLNTATYTESCRIA